MYFMSEAAYPGFDAKGNYLPNVDVQRLRFILQARLYDDRERYLEVGSFTGTTAILACRANYDEVICVDTWSGGSDPSDWVNDLYSQTGEDVYETFLRNVKGLQVKPLRMSSLAAAKTIEDGSVDVLFIDADHSYQATLADIKAWLPKVKSGGVLCGHDYGDLFPGVKQAVDEMFGEAVRVRGTVWSVPVE